MDFDLVAHRGFSAIAPENTLSAFDAALQNGANAIEFDVHLSADGIPVIIHDATVERTTDGSGNVRDRTLAQLKQLDAGLWFSDRFIGERIPTFQETLDLLKETSLCIYPEVKQAEDWSAADIDKFIATILSQGWQDRCIIASFCDEFLEKIRDRTSEIMLAYYPLTPSDYLDKVRQLQLDERAFLLSEYHLLLDNPSLVETSKNNAIEVGAWTVDYQQDLEQLVELGVTKIITNTLLVSSNQTT